MHAMYVYMNACHIYMTAIYVYACHAFMNACHVCIYECNLPYVCFALECSSNGVTEDITNQRKQIHANRLDGRIWK